VFKHRIDIHPTLSRKGTGNSVGRVEKGQRSNEARREEASDKVKEGAMSSGHL